MVEKTTAFAHGQRTKLHYETGLNEFMSSKMKSSSLSREQKLNLALFNNDVSLTQRHSASHSHEETLG